MRTFRFALVLLAPLLAVSTLHAIAVDPARETSVQTVTLQFLGVVQQDNSATVINGLRTSYSNMTLDGINIQDTYFRDNALDYTPNRLLLGQIRQMTLVTSNQNAAAPGGATQLAFETPPRGNTFHGGAYWYNRNNELEDQNTSMYNSPRVMQFGARYEF